MKDLFLGGIGGASFKIAYPMKILLVYQVIPNYKQGTNVNVMSLISRPTYYY